MKEIKAKDGCWLTQASLREGDKRGFWSRLFPACSLTEADFVEWTDAERQAWEAGHPDEPDDEISDAEALDIITGRAEA